MNPQLQAAFASIAAGMGIPLSAVQQLQHGNVTGAAGSLLRSKPPKADVPPGGFPQAPQAPSPQPQPPPAQSAGLPPGPPPPPAGPPPPPPGPDLAGQMNQIAGQMNTAPQTPPQVPKMQDPNKGFLLGEALSAIVAPQTLPFVGAALSYDQGQREQDYGRKYQAAMDAWRARADSMQATNQGLMDKAEILKAQAAMPASLAADRSVPIPDQAKLNKMTPWEQDNALSEYYGKVAAARLAAGATKDQVQEMRDQATFYIKRAAEDRMVAIQEGKMAAPPGTRLPDGTIVQPGDQAAILYQQGVAKLQFEQARTAFEKGAIARADKSLMLRAQQIANTAGFHSQEIQARYAFGETPQERLTIALLGLENGNAKMSHAEAWQLGKDLYDKQMAEYKAYSDAQAKGQDTSGFTQTTQPVAPPPAPNVNVNVEIPQAQAAAQQVANPPKPGANNAKPPAEAGGVSTLVNSPAVNALPPKIKMTVTSLSQIPGMTLDEMHRRLADLSSGKKKSPSLSPAEAAAANHALYQASGGK